jgi:hypothetical protein
VADINQLSAVDTLNAGDLLPIWKTNNGDTRKAAISVLQAYMQNNLTFPSVAAGVSQFVPQYASPVATGFTVTLTSNSDNRWLILTPLAGYAAGTIVFPALANVVDNQEILIVSTQAIAALTINGNGATVIGAPAYVSANGGFRFKFNALGGIWYRLDEDLDPDLAALAGVSSSGLLARTGAGTAAARTVTGSTGLTVTNGDGVSGNPTLTLDATLAGISAVTTASDQLVYSTGVDTFATTSFTAAGRALVDDASAAAQRTTLGVGTGDSPSFTAVVAEGTNGQKSTYGIATQSIAVTGATAVATGIIPANCLLLGVTTRITTDIVIGGGGVNFDIGNGTDADAFANNITALTANSTTNIAQHTITTPAYYGAAANVVLTPDAGTFSSGQIRISAHYISLTAPTS